MLSAKEKLLGRDIFNRPEVYAAFLNKQGIEIGDKPTLFDITRKVYWGIYYDKNDFVKKLDDFLKSPEHQGFIGLAIMGAIAVAGVVSSGIQAKKARKAAQDLGLLETYQTELLTEKQIDAEKSVQRSQILANTVAQYQQTLAQKASLNRQATAYIVLAVGGVLVLGIILNKIFK